MTRLLATYGLRTAFVLAMTFGAEALALGETVLGNTPAPVAREKPPESFGAARDQRSRLLGEIPPLKDAIERLRRQKANIMLLQTEKRNIEKELVRGGKELEAAQKARASAKSEADMHIAQIRVLNIQNFQNGARVRLEEADQALRDAGVDAQKVEDELTRKEAELSKLQENLEATEQKISDLLNVEKPQQQFKQVISGVFAVLVAGVMFGFFRIASSDERVRIAIFSGTAGIQFVTLFSLVIAIILFGVIDILEAKELSALLGGLSGYILGRGTSERGESEPGSARQAGTLERKQPPQGETMSST